MPKKKRNLQTPKPPDILQQLRKLHLLAPSEELSAYLATFKTPKDHTIEVFITGIKEFTRIANLKASERIKFFGNQFGGLHYNNDLVELWHTHSAEKIKAHQLNKLLPPQWDYVLEDVFKSLIYRGNKPAQALDKLLQGPTVIDCGMFCQLSVWFGIRYMLGDEKFNQVFGNTPFHITQLLYEEIKDPMKPYRGNPLYPFFVKGSVIGENSVGVVNIQNHPLYQIKHPGGNYQADNCMVIDGTYTIFDPNLPQTSGLQETDIEELLRKNLNAPQNVHDANKIALYAETPEKVHPKWGFTFKKLIEMSQNLANLKLDEHVWKSDRISLESRFRFDFEEFKRWLENMHQNTIYIKYTPLKDQQHCLPLSLIEQIPFENRDNIGFSSFKVETPLQQELLKVSLHFCQKVMCNQSCSITLTGKAGIGKTASAASCAKELASRNKKVIWISEVMVNGWMSKAESMAEVEACRNNIKLLLHENPDAVFLDDDNLIGYAGEVLLEEIYAWYVSNPGKGLFITSNEEVTFEKRYGLRLDGKYYFPPFPGYTSPAYQNTLIRRGLTGQSLRASPVLDAMILTDDCKMALLCICPAKQSIGIIVDPKAYAQNQHQLNSVELIPAIDEELLTQIRQSLRETGNLGPAYQKLNEQQKKWLRQFQAGGGYLQRVDGSCYKVPYHKGIGVKPFEASKCEIIAIEISLYQMVDGDKIIGLECMNHLLQVINYAHDQGGKKVIIINNTNLSPNELIEQIKADIPEHEKERTVARLDNLFFSQSLILPLKLVIVLVLIVYFYKLRHSPESKQETKEEKPIQIAPKTAMINGSVPTLFFQSASPHAHGKDDPVWTAFNDSKRTVYKVHRNNIDACGSNDEFKTEITVKHPNLARLC